MWDSLIELAHLNSSKSSRITALIEFFNREDAEQSIDLYQQLQKGKLGKDEFDRLLEKGASSQALERLEEQFVHTYFFSNLERSGFNDYHSAEVECWKNWVAVKLLFGRSAMIFPQKACLKILKQADRFGFHRLSIDIAKQLRLYYGAQLGDVKRFKKYDDLIKQEKQKLHWVKLASKALRQVKLSLLRNERIDNIRLETAKVVQKLEEVPAAQQSFQFGYQLYLLKIQRSFLEQEWSVLADLCEEAATFCSKTLKRSKGNLDHIFQLLKVFTWFRNKELDKAGQVLKKIENYEKKGTPLWFDNHRYAFILAIHQGRYANAAKLLKKMRSHSKFKLLHPAKAAVWLIFERYIHFLQQIKVLDASVAIHMTEEHQGLNREEVLKSAPIPVFAHEVMLSLILDMIDGKNKTNSKATILEKEIPGLKNKGYFRLAALGELLVKKITKPAGEGINHQKYKERPIIADLDHCFFEEIIPPELLFRPLTKQGPQFPATQ